MKNSVEIVAYCETYGKNIDALIKRSLGRHFGSDGEAWIRDTGHRCFVAIDKEGSRFLGFLFLELKEDPFSDRKYGYVPYMAVEETERNKGVGKQLYQTAEDYVRARGCTEIELTCADFREDSHLFYQSIGYEKKRTTVYIKEFEKNPK